MLRAQSTRFLLQLLRAQAHSPHCQPSRMSQSLILCNRLAAQVLQVQLDSIQQCTPFGHQQCAQAGGQSLHLCRSLTQVRTVVQMGQGPTMPEHTTTTMAHTLDAAPQFSARPKPSLPAPYASQTTLVLSRLPVPLGRLQWHAPHSADAQSGALLRR